MSREEVTSEDWKAKSKENLNCGDEKWKKENKTKQHHFLPHSKRGNLHRYMQYGGTKSWVKLFCVFKILFEELGEDHDGF